MDFRPRVPQLRIAVNSRCGRACVYCRPSGESIPTTAAAELSCDAVVTVCAAAKKLGIEEVKLTGGDPAFWEPLADCASRLKKELGIRRLDVISRDPRIGEIAPALAAAGADLITVSMDTLDPARHHEITGKEDLDGLIDAIRRCVDTGVTCKINMVLMGGMNDMEVEPMIEFCEEARGSRPETLGPDRGHGGRKRTEYGALGSVSWSQPARPVCFAGGSVQKSYSDF